MVKIGPVCLEKKMLTQEDGRKPLAIGHLSYSGELIKKRTNMNKVLKIMQHKTHTWIILTQGVAHGTFRGHKHMNESELINKHLAWFFLN